ncbi:MAG: hypothetical protein HY805_08785 [Nitrospirae bacterium]|nr:hypothetical protein [Nitrospirota bacterium]
MKNATLNNKSDSAVHTPISVDKEIGVHLAEYQALRSEIELYSQRIDKTAGLYITAMFGIIGYLLRPDSTFDLQQYLRHIESTPVLTALFMFIPILNSLLLLRIGSFFLGILAIAQYIQYEIKPRLTALLGSTVLYWDDEPSLDAKRKWILLRSAGQMFFVIIVETTSIVFLGATTYAISSGFVLGVLYIIACGCVMVSVISLIKVARAGQNFHRSQAHNRMQSKKDK